MIPKRLLVANRGEIAIRILRAAAELDLRSVAVHSQDDDRSLHTRRADEARELAGTGPAAYLDIAGLIQVARETECDAVHPGYGFLSERADFAAACIEAGLVFVGPRPETLALLGDKTRARELAERCDVPVLPGTAGPTDVEGARAFLASLGEGGAMVIKAVAGGGGRGLRVVQDDREIAEAHERCRSEAQAAFGNGAVYCEQWITRARHVEVQIAGDGHGRIVHLGERDCSVQRRHQKLIELAPCPNLPAVLRDAITTAAVRLAEECRYFNLGTFEFLVDADGSGAFAFIEANPRLQVEHTVTEAVTGLDLVQTQLLLAMGRSLASLDLDQDQVPAPRGFAMQLRINTETLAADGSVKPSAGTLTAFQLPSGPGVRTDASGYPGHAISPRFDSLLAKLIVHTASDDFRDLVVRADRALAECHIEGVSTNVDLLRAILRHGEFSHGGLHTRFVDTHLASLVDAAGDQGSRLSFPARSEEAADALAGARIDRSDPLAVLAHGKSAASRAPAAATPPPGPAIAVTGPPGTRTVAAPMQGTVVSVEVQPGDAVRIDQPLVVLEAMKMEHVIGAAASGIVREVAVAAGDTVFEGHPLAFVEDAEVASIVESPAEGGDLTGIRPDLAEVEERHGFGHDKNRPDAVARRRKTGQRTSRENIADLCDPGSFVEYGSLVIAAQRRRRELDDLIARTPADGLLSGVGRVNGDLFPDVETRCVVMAYDYTVLAGTQGQQNHRKKDRLFEIAEERQLPLVFFTEGGGGRPGDTDGVGVAGLDCLAFRDFGRLSGLVPLVGINSGRCFAGNAALLGCCDVVIATANSNIGMGGPAMIEGGGLGIFRPEEVGPMAVQVPNGVVDVPVEDESEAVEVAKRYLGYFQGALAEFDCADQRLLRGAIPENRLRVYDVRHVIETLADADSVLELRRAFGPGMVTALARIEGRPIGIIANNPTHLAGAIDSPGADKAARFMQLCDAFDLPIVFLCDTPGIMVGPEAEKTALVRHASRMFVTGASLTVPFCTIVLRKGYGLGAQAMAGGSFHAPLFTIAWPTGEFGGMGLEGAVKLGFRKELEAVEDAGERKALFDRMVARMYEHGKAVNMASHFEIDDVIDPVDTRRWIRSALPEGPVARRRGKKRPSIDTW